jgi:hypothetical protein
VDEGARAGQDAGTITFSNPPTRVHQSIHPPAGRSKEPDPREGDMPVLLVSLLRPHHYDGDLPRVRALLLMLRLSFTSFALVRENQKKRRIAASGPGRQLRLARHTQRLAARTNGAPGPILQSQSASPSPETPCASSKKQQRFITAIIVPVCSNPFAQSHHLNTFHPILNSWEFRSSLTAMPDLVLASR